MAEYIERKTAVKAAEHAWDEWNLAMAAADGRREINLVYKRQELCKAVASVFTSAPAADVAPIEALERLRDELCAQDQITMEGLKKLNTLIWKCTQVHDGGAGCE